MALGCSFATFGPTSNTDPSGQLKVESRYRGFVGGRAFHADVFVTDKVSTRIYWASAENQGSSDSSSGSSQSLSGIGSGNGFGNIVKHKADSRNDPHPDFFKGGHRQVVFDDGGNCDYSPSSSNIETKIENTFTRVDAKNIKRIVLR